MAGSFGCWQHLQLVRVNDSVNIELKRVCLKLKVRNSVCEAAGRPWRQASPIMCTVDQSKSTVIAAIRPPARRGNTLHVDPDDNRAEQKKGQILVYANHNR